jgi:hypothetical protein
MPEKEDSDQKRKKKKKAKAKESKWKFTLTPHGSNKPIQLNPKSFSFQITHPDLLKPGQPRTHGIITFDVTPPPDQDDRARAILRLAQQLLHAAKQVARDDSELLNDNHLLSVNQSRMVLLRTQASEMQAQLEQFGLTEDHDRSPGFGTVVGTAILEVVCVFWSAPWFNHRTAKREEKADLIQRWTMSFEKVVGNLRDVLVCQSKDDPISPQSQGEGQVRKQRKELPDPTRNALLRAKKLLDQADVKTRYGVDDVMKLFGLRDIRQREFEQSSKYCQRSKPKRSPWQLPSTKGRGARKPRQAGRTLGSTIWWKRTEVLDAVNGWLDRIQSKNSR